MRRFGHEAKSFFRQKCRAFGRLLTVVENEQQAGSAHVPSNRRRKRLAGLITDVEGMRDRAQDVVGIANGREIDEHAPVGGEVDRLARHLESKTGLADATHADESDQTCLGQLPLEMLELSLASYEARQFWRQSIRSLGNAGTRHLVTEDPPSSACSSGLGSMPSCSSS